MARDLRLQVLLSTPSVPSSPETTHTLIHL